MRIFISYSSPDFQVADQLRLALATQRSSLNIYFAPRRNEVGAYWITRLGEELQQADVVVLLLGRQIGTWQELEYYDALHRNRNIGQPMIAPILVADTAPGLPFLDQFHRLSLSEHSFDDLILQLLQSFDGTTIGDDIASWRLINPYRGLLAMETRDAAFFFGREALTGEILNEVAAQNDKVLTLVGNSGVGKSSLAMAGVIASLRSRIWPGDSTEEWSTSLQDSHRWPVVIFKPGETPVKSLALACVSQWLDSAADIEIEALKWRQLLLGDSSLSALINALLVKVGERAEAEAPDRVLLYIDQGEELYSRSESEEARRFSELLAEAIEMPQLVVMLSLRSDYYGRLQEDKVLFQTTAIIDVTPMGRDDIERVIRLPAEKLGVSFDPPEMVARIAEAAAREPGALPMLSDLLADAWQTMATTGQENGILQFAVDIVDISRPLADKAERFIAAHPQQSDLLHRLFTLKLSHVPKEGDIVRRRARRSECSDVEWQLIEVMSAQDWRLLTTSEEGGEAVAEVAHEALLRYWPRAVRWLDDSREFLIWKGQFESEYRSWEQADEAVRERALLSGLRLDAASHWLQERADDLVSGEKTFIASSRQAVNDRLALEQQAQLRLTRQRTWIQRLSYSALIVVALIAAVALWQAHKARLAEQAASNEQQKTRQALEQAQQQATLADARRLAIAAEQVLDDNSGETTLAGLLATESVKRSPTLEGKRVLRRVLELTPESSNLETPWTWTNIIYSPDDRLVAYYRNRDETTELLLVDRSSGNEISRIVNDRDLLDVLFSPDANYLATVSVETGELKIWETKTGTLVDKILDRSNWVYFSPDSRRLITGKFNSGNFILDLETKDRLPFIHGSRVAYLEYADEIDRAITWGEGSIKVWDTRDGSLAATHNSKGKITRLVISRNGRSVAYLTDRKRDTSEDENFESLVIWKPDSDDDAVVIPMSNPYALSIDAAGEQLAVRQGQTTIRQIDIDSRRTLATIRILPGRRISSMQYSPDAEYFYFIEQQNQQRGLLKKQSLQYGLRVLDTGTDSEVARIDTRSAQLAFPKAGQVAMRNMTGQWRSWKLESAGADQTLLNIRAEKVNYIRHLQRVVFSDDNTLPKIPALLHGKVIKSPRVDGELLNIWTSNSDGSKLAAMKTSGISINDTTNGNELAFWSDGNLQGAGISVGHNLRAIRGMRFADNGNTLLAYDTVEFDTEEVSSGLWMWRWQSQSPLELSNESPISQIAISPDESQFATAEAGKQPRVRVWDAITGEIVRELPTEEAADAVAYSPNGDHLAIRTAKQVIVLRTNDWFESGRFEFKGLITSAATIRFSPDGNFLLAEAPGGVQIWSLDGEYSQLLQHGSDWPEFNVSDDGLVIAWNRNTLNLWDFDSGNRLFDMNFVDNKYRTLFFTGPNQDLVGLTESGLVRILWKSEELIEIACRRFKRDLTEQEWQVFFSDEEKKNVCAI